MMGPKESAAFIASKAIDVKVNQVGIKKVAAEISRALDSGDFTPNNMMLHSYPLPTAEDNSSIEWLFVTDALNFSFWREDDHYSIELHGVCYTGYMALCAAVTRALEAGIPITSSKFYANIDIEVVDRIFKSSQGESIPMLEERLKVLKESGKILNEKFDGAFLNCLKKCNNSAQELLNLIILNFPSFRDSAYLDGTAVTFYKRAQILVADIWGLFKGKGVGSFRDIDTITMFADYRVPQTLIYFGALEYSEKLNNLLGSSHMFSNGDRYEVEIRGCSIHAVELIREELKQRAVNISQEKLPLNSAMIDFFLWEFRRRFAKDLLSIPFHRVRSIYY
uniref:Queuosine 5'-phosphate N-glycosylase/hydrolase n=1 Tax=Scapholeberis mucronata TaxID=202097 RepID=A0A4Y7NKJ7_9CRUS|nr:EOG090X0A16 [Scapholeberis mucronata]